jgi:hypothetical protein
MPDIYRNSRANRKRRRRGQYRGSGPIRVPIQELLMTDDQFKLHVVDALARVETKVTDLVGNGQPGRVTNLEAAVKKLQRFSWIITGAVLAVSAIIHFVFKY